MSPYHYRLDWETWIRVTASLESLWAQKAPPESYHQHLPDFLQALVVKILNGDDDAAGLMGVPLPELYRQGEPPTAVSIDFASYTFTSAKNSTRWWRARPVGKASLRAYGRESVVMPSGEVRKSPRGRHWLLALSAVGSLRLLELGFPRPGPMLAVVVLALIFVLVLSSDYVPAFAGSQLLPALKALGCAEPVTVALCQQCCYGLVPRLALGAAGVNATQLLLSWRRCWAEASAAVVLLAVAWISHRIDL